MNVKTERYAKQILFAEMDEAKQQQLLNSRVLLCGCGALGSVLADLLVRAGVGFLRIVDRDFVELSNLQRQVLYNEEDVANHIPKAIAASSRLKKINSDVTIEPVVADINHTNILQYAEEVDLILDGTDNFEIRFLINDVSLETNIPWIYAGVIGSHGQTMTIFPHETGCLRCLIDTPPEAGTTETCDTAGVLAPAVNVVSSLEAIDAIKILSGQKEKVAQTLTVLDVWEGSLRQMKTANLRDKGDCAACHHGERLWLTGKRGSTSTILCGRNAVQITPPTKTKINFDELAEKLKSSGKVEQNAYLLRLTLSNPDYEITLFHDGRAIVKGTEEMSIARSVYSRYIGG